MAKRRQTKIDDLEKVDIGFFLQQVCGIQHADTSKMTHEAVSAFFPDLKRTSYSHILKNPELMRTGKVVLVRDSAYNSAPYIVPVIPIISLEEQPISKDVQLNDILNTFKNISFIDEDALLLFEGNELLDKYIYSPRVLKEANLMSELLEASKLNRGLIHGRYGNVYSYDNLVFNGKITTFPTLENQAIALTTLVDAYALLIEGDNQISFIFDGMKYNDLDEPSLKTMMEMYFLDTPLQITKERRDIKNYALHKIAVYELVALMKFYKATGQTSYYHKVRKALIKTTGPKKEFREKRAKQKIKEIEDD